MQLSVHLAASPEAVFAAIGDFGALADWDPFVSSAQLEVGDGLALGSRYALRSPVGLTVRYEVIELEAPHRVTYRGGTKRVTTTDTIVVAAAENGSNLTVTSALVFSGWARFVAPIITAVVQLGGRFVSFPALRRHLARR